jgi:hypothetical protein
VITGGVCVDVRRNVVNVIMNNERVEDWRMLYVHSFLEKLQIRIDAPEIVHIMSSSSQ